VAIGVACAVYLSVRGSVKSLTAPVCQSTCTRTSRAGTSMGLTVSSRTTIRSRFFRSACVVVVACQTAGRSVASERTWTRGG
jgi:hypothetical protein